MKQSTLGIFGPSITIVLIILVAFLLRDCSINESVKPIKQQAIISQHDRDPNKLEPLLDAIEYVEGWDGKPTLGIDGERGPYQITEAYWRDSGELGDFELCDSKPYAKNVVVAYMRRYCPDAIRNNDWEVIARIHNGGPTGNTKSSTKQYWYRVFFYMDRKLEEGLTK